MVSCYMASHYGWKITGYDIKEELSIRAKMTAERYNLEDKIEFRICTSEKTLSIGGRYDAVFLKKCFILYL